MNSRSLAQKRMKTSMNELIKEEKGYDHLPKHKKSVKIPSKHSRHLKSCSKDISRATFIDVTPKKNGKAPKIKERSHKNSIKNKHLNSCINYELSDKYHHFDK